jgi:hypothetical protein
MAPIGLGRPPIATPIGLGVAWSGNCHTARPVSICVGGATRPRAT